MVHMGEEQFHTQILAIILSTRRLGTHISMCIVLITISHFFSWVCIGPLYTSEPLKNYTNLVYRYQARACSCYVDYCVVSINKAWDCAKSNAKLARLSLGLRIEQAEKERWGRHSVLRLTWVYKWLLRKLLQSKQNANNVMM